MDTLASFPFVIVRIGCEACTRQGAYRLARLAAKYGAEIAMPDLLAKLAADCPWMNRATPVRRKMPSAICGFGRA
jgi:hypothetical protein